jgi:TonB-dependent receptor
MSRVTGMSLVDNQYVFVRGLGERYSNTTLAGSTIPTTEPDKKVVPLDLFPSGLIDSVQVAKSYSAEKSAEFAGGLVQIVPLKLPNRPVGDFSYGISRYSTATGKDILLSSLGNRDWLGYDNGARALPGGFPSNKIVRQGIYTPDVGYTPDQITQFGRLLDNTWRPQTASGAPGQNWGIVLGNRFNRLGLIASVSHSYKEQYVEEDRNFYAIGAGGELEAVNEYAMQYGTEKAQLGVVGNIAYQFTPNHRLSVENFYSHSGRDEGRFFEGDNFENNFRYRNYRLQFIEEGLISNAVTGEHFFQNAGNSRIDWRVNVARANRDEPDLREVLYQGALGNPNATFTLADESQSGYRQFNTLDDETVDVGANWSIFQTSAGRATQYKFGLGYVERTRDFQSRRFHFIPIAANKDSAVPAALTSTPEQLFTSANIGVAFRLNEETLPDDAYDGEQTTTAGYGMVDVGLTSSTRLVAGLRVERFDQQVNSFDPFGLFIARVSSENKNTDVFPSVNLVQSMRFNSNIRVSYSTTVNRPEFRELAEFEFTDVVGNRAIRGNPDLERALIQNLDGRWEMFMGARGIIAASAFYKYFDKPIERIVVGGAQPLATFQNADSARNFGFELEAAQDFLRYFFVNANYTYVDSKITLVPEQRTVMTSLERALAGQSKNLFNVMGEFAVGGFSTRVLFNYFDDRISDVGANEAPDVIEQGRGSLDLVFSQRWRGLGIRLNLDNLTDTDYLFTQTAAGIEETQRLFRLGRTVTLSFGYNLF